MPDLQNLNWGFYMPSISEVLSRAATNQSNVRQFLSLQLDLEQIIRVLNLDYKLTPETLHMACGVIYLYYAEALSKETTEELNRISVSLRELTSTELSEDEYTLRAMPFLFTLHNIHPIIARLNLPSEHTLILRRIINEICRAQLHSSYFLIALLNALQINEICSELLAARSCATTHRNSVFAAPQQQQQPHLSNASSSTDFVIIDRDEWDEMDDFPSGKNA